VSAQFGIVMMALDGVILFIIDKERVFMRADVNDNFFLKTLLWGWGIEGY